MLKSTNTDFFVIILLLVLTLKVLLNFDYLKKLNNYFCLTYQSSIDSNTLNNL